MNLLNNLCRNTCAEMLQFNMCWQRNLLHHYCLLLFQGIGDNSQGFANFLLFCLFCKKIRERFQQLCVRDRQRIVFNSEEEDPLIRSTNSYGSVDYK